MGEAFGYYFNRQGEIVYRGRHIGLSLEDLEKVEMTIAIAGGAAKAEAVAAVCPVSGSGVLVTDEAAARAILERAH